MPRPVDDHGTNSNINPLGGVGNKPYGPFAPTDSTTVSTLPGLGTIAWEKPHDHRALYLPLLRGKKLARGYMVQDKNDPAVKKNKHGKPLGLHFLYNPTTVQVSYQLSTDIYPSADAPGSAVPLIGVPGSASLGFDLILDRTYDTWHNSASRGIKYDVEQFQNMLGYDAATPFIQPVSMWVVFGNPVLKYYGFIQSFSIVYTNWTQAMVPYRGAISGITMQVLPSGKVKNIKPPVSAASKAAGLTNSAGSDGTGRGGKKKHKAAA